MTRTRRHASPSPSLSWRSVMPAAIDTTRCCGRRRERNSARTPDIVCGLTARTITSLVASTLALSPPGRTPVSAAKASRAWGSGSLADSRSGAVSPAASQPRASAAAILPAPTKPIRGTVLMAPSFPVWRASFWILTFGVRRSPPLWFLTFFRGRKRKAQSGGDRRTPKPARQKRKGTPFGNRLEKEEGAGHATASVSGGKIAGRGRGLDGRPLLAPARRNQHKGKDHQNTEADV